MRRLSTKLRTVRLQTERAAAEELAARLGGVLVKISVPAGADDRFYGSVTAKDIAEALREQFGIEIDRRKIVLADNIKAFGSYTVDAKLYTEVVAHINILVSKK